jgi:hypothetical protein
LIAEDPPPPPPSTITTAGPVANPLFEIAEKESFGAAHADTPRTIIGTARTANSFDLLIFFMLFSPYLSDT